MSAADVAAHTLTLRVAGIAYAVPAALLQAAMVRMARAEIVGDPAACRSVMVGSLWLSIGAGTALCLLLTFAAAPLAHSVFDDTPAGLAAAGMAAGLLLLLGAMELIVNPGSAAAGLLRGRKDTRAPMLFSLAGYWAVGAPLGLWLCETRDLGITGLWIGVAVGAATTTVLMLARLAGFLKPRSGPKQKASNRADRTRLLQHPSRASPWPERRQSRCPTS
jgi:MATE family multidrug resistance protein